ncbi:MAG: hypothetical protein ACLFN7_04750 [Candidatus Acetothermia bacterium]
MKSVRQIKEVLGLDTIHQARNRIKAVEEVIQPYMKRGENNEILVGQEGVTILSRLQDLYESGLLLSEAAEVIRSDASPDEIQGYDTDSYSTEQDQIKQDLDFVEYLREEIQFQRELIIELADQTPTGETKKKAGSEKEMWWTDWL